MHSAVFLDRDGTLVVDRGYLDNVAGIELLPGTAAALARLQAAGFILVVVTNQSGIGRGFYARSMVAAQHRRLGHLLAAAGICIAAVEVCPHTPAAGCPCRKPAPAMFFRAARRLGIDLARSYMVGDKGSDVLAGRRAGCKALRLGKGAAGSGAVMVEDLERAADWILADAAGALEAG